MYHANIQGVYFQIQHRSTTEDFGIRKKRASPKIVEFLLQLNLVKTQETSAQQK
jgi:hypothetical protein